MAVFETLVRVVLQKDFFFCGGLAKLSCSAAQMIVAWATFQAEAAAAQLSPARRTTQPVSALSRYQRNCNKWQLFFAKKKFAHRQQFSVQ